MNQLLYEILTEIFLQLEQYGKVECMVVCQHWKQVMDRFALYHTLCAYYTSSLNKIIEMILKHASKVLRLVIGLFDEEYDTELNRLLLLLPNLKAICCTGPHMGKLVPDTPVTYPWERQIEYINEYATNSITLSLLRQPCLNLTSLEFNDMNETVMLVLENLPDLRRLKVTFGHYMPGFIGYIHRDCPQLESLSLHGTPSREPARSGEVPIVS